LWNSKLVLVNIKKRSAGPDRLTNEMLINLSDVELSTILKFINKTLREGKIHTEWRTPNIIPILKNVNNQIMFLASDLGP
jgi:hypothetical protein